jgi:DNA-binding MarR family transcriptional regulator
MTATHATNNSEDSSRLQRDEVTDLTLQASRALLGVVARSVAEALDVVTLPQFRVLVMLDAAGPLRMGVLAERMGANASTFTRSVDRMVENGWVVRKPSPDSRREVIIALTRAGKRIVEKVTTRRRHELAAILERLTPAEVQAVGVGLQTFARAAGEPLPEDLLTLGL